MLAIQRCNESLAKLHRLYLDFDSFFASAEQHFNPTLRGQAVGVVPLDAPGTSCIAVSREAKARGVKSGASVVSAREIAPDMVFVVARPDAYVRLHHCILAVIERCVPIAKVRSIDELVCHLLPSEALHAAQLAQKIKASIARKFSGVLTCSIGFAQTELLAKIAAEMNKPDGLVLLSTYELPGRIEHLSLRDLPGVSEGIERRLGAAGIQSIAQLWTIESKQARAIWGNVEGERFWNELHGLHMERPLTKKRMFGHSRSLPSDWRSQPKVRECARQLALSAARRLRRTEMSASKLTLGMRGDGYRSSRSKPDKSLRWSCEIALTATRNDQAFLRALSEGFSQCSREVTFNPRSVSVMLHGLVNELQIQPDLFAAHGETITSGQEPAQIIRQERLSEVLDQLRAAYGPKAVSYGPRVDLPGGYLGGKIAFGRIPDLQDFSDAQTRDEATHFYSH